MIDMDIIIHSYCICPLGTIHLILRQNFMIFDPYPLPSAISLLCLQIQPIFDPSPLKNAAVVSKNMIDFDPPLKKFHNRTHVILGGRAYS